MTTLFLIFFTIAQNIGQSDNITLNLYRMNALCSECNVQVLINDEFIANLKNAETIELKFKKEQTVKLSITSSNPEFLYHYNLKLKKGRIYDYNVKPRIPRIKGFKLKVLDPYFHQFEFHERLFNIN